MPSTLNEFLERALKEQKNCPEGEQWCPIQKKCVPIGSGDGKGQRQKRQRKGFED